MIVAGKTVGKIGLGCVTFGREINSDASFAMMDHAIANGIYFFDTAAAYGGGRSEEIVGNWLASRKNEVASVVVATKILPPYDASGIVKAVDASRRRLRADTIDLLFLHRWDEAVLSSESLITLDRLVQSGVVGELGASNFSLEQMQQAIKMQEFLQLKNFSFAQNNHNYAVREYTPSYHDFCKDHRVNMITYSPLGAGFLTGKHQLRVQSGSRFELIPAHQDVYFNEIAEKRLQRLLNVAERSGYSPVQVALAWAFHQPAAMILMGGRTTNHLDQALSAMIFNDDAVLRQLED